MRKKNKIILSLILTAFLSLFFLMNFVSASDTSSDVEYGLLYNWYTVDDSRGLCPEGWHVPSYTEFQTFHEYLEPVSYFYMDYKIKEVGTDHWVPNEGATDETGFSALGGGMRTYTGIFIELKERADFISSTSFSEVYPEQNRSYDCFEIYLSSYSSGDIWVGANRKKAGSSVRCIRDSSDEWAEGEVVVDYDGNVYDTVQIGTQIWLRQNLAVTHYRNGDEIPEVIDNSEWAALTTGAFCAYDNDWDYVFKSLEKPISSCGTLSESGKTYVLTKDVISTDTCFNITAENVTLNCNNKTIIYSTSGNANTYGVYTNQESTTIKNCNILDGNFDSSQYTRTGIFLDSADNSKVSNNFINTNKSAGIYLYNSANFNELSSNKIVNNYRALSEALRVEKSSNNILTNNFVEGRGGITIIESPDNTLTNNVGISALQSGIGTYYSPNTMLVNNTGKSYDPDGVGGYTAGIRIYDSPNNTLINNTGITTNSKASGNPYGGITVYRSQNSNLINNLGICEKGLNAGILLDYSSNQVLIGNTGISADSKGIYLLGSSNNTLIDSIAIGANYGVLLERSSNNLFKDCNIQGTTGVYLNGSSVYSTNNTFLNCSYDTEEVSAGNELIRKWYYQAEVKDSSNNPLSEAEVSAYDTFNNLQFSALTDSSGFIPKQEILDYVNLGGTKTYYSNYSISASKTGYTPEIHTVDFTTQQNKIDDIFTLKVVDTVPPMLKINSPLNNWIYRRPVLFSVTAIDDSGIKSCVYSLDFNKNVTMTNIYGDYWTSKNYLISKGCHFVTFYCTDNSGLVSSQKSYFKVK